MKRRTFVATLPAVALAGCTGAPTTGDEPDTTTAGTTTDLGTFPYAVDNVRTADSPVENVTMAVTATRHFTEDHPASVEVSFTNDAADARTFVFGSLVPWDGLWGAHQSTGASLLLAPSDGVVPQEPTDDCWRATDGIALADVMREETVDPGETVSSEFAVLAAHDSDDCHPQGTYRFEKENYLDHGWWFELDVVPIADA